MKGSLSALTSALIIFMILTSLLTYMTLELRKIPSRLAKLNYELVSQASTSAKDIEVVLNDEGLYLRSANPPIKLLSLLSISNSGISNLLSNLTISKTYEKILTKEAVDAILLSNSYLLIILEGGKYFIINNEFVKNPALAGALSNGELIKLQNLSNYLKPFLYVGILKDLNSYMSNPIPGLPLDPEANYIPVGYVWINSNSHTISKGDWFIYTDPRSTPYKIGHVYGSGQTTINYLGMGYYKMDSDHNVFVKWYESVSGYTSGWYISYETIMTGVAGFWAYPIVAIGNKTIDLVFEVKNLGNPTTIYLRPVIYVIMPEDYVKGSPIIPHQTNPTLEASIRYSAIRPLYSWEGNLDIKTLWTNLTTTLSLTLDSGTVLRSLDANAALVLVGFRFASTNALSIRLTSYILNYDIDIDVGIDEVGKYVFLPASTNVVPEIISPNGSKVIVYRPTNLISSIIDYPALFIPQLSGTYIVRYKLGTYTSLPQLNLQISLGSSNYEPLVEYLRNQHLGGWSKVVNDLIILEPNYAVLRDYEYFTAGSETWYSGDLIKVSNLPVNAELNFTYYITASLQGTTTLNTGQNRSVDYIYCWSSWSCYRYWRVNFTSYLSNSTTRLHISGEVLYPTGSYYLRFGITVKLSDITLTATSYIIGIKHIYKSSTTPYITFLSPQFAELIRINNNLLIFS